jgi:ABC-type sulfate/molybdate transport systems ATPase subunit
VPAVVEIAHIVKDYRGLRPLRLSALTLEEGERVALSGLDAAAAEIFVHLITGAALPDIGDIRVLGQSTSMITSGEHWLASLDRFGLMSPRAVLLDESTVAQNLAVPFGLQIDPVPPAVMSQVEVLSAEAGLATEWLSRPVRSVPGRVRARVHLARAVALGPAALVLEHPTVDVERRDVAPFARDVRRLAERRRLATLAITEDSAFAEGLEGRWLKVDLATGAIGPMRTRRGWFR